MRGPSVGKCALCHKTTSLKGSHIISRWALSKLEEDGVFIYITDDKFVKCVRAKNGPAEHLYCGDCEQIRGISEGYVSKRWEDLMCSEFNYVENEDCYCPKHGFDYRELKLFFLGTLLTFSAAAYTPIFKDFNLDACVHSELRSMCLKRNPGSKDKFSVTLFRFSDDSPLSLGSCSYPYESLGGSVLTFQFLNCLVAISICETPRQQKFASTFKLLDRCALEPSGNFDVVYLHKTICDGLQMHEDMVKLCRKW